VPVITPGNAATVTITTAGQVAQQTFSGLLGQSASVQITNYNFDVDCSNVTVSILFPNGSTLASGNACGSAFQNPVTLPTSGIYILQIAPQNNGIGYADVTLSLLGGQTATTITSGIAAVVNMGTAGQNAQLTFSGVAGQLASVQVSNSDSLNCNLYVSIISPDGTPLTRPNNSCSSSFFLNPVTLPATGTYTVLVAPANGTTGTATITLWLFNNQTGSIASGTATPVSLSIPGQADLLTFSGVAGQLASVQVSNSNSLNCNLYVSIISPDGTPLAQPNNSCSSSFFLNPIPLPATGTYTVLVAPANGTTGAATITLWLFSEQESGGVLSGTPTPITMNISGQSQAMPFTGVAGQFADVQFANSTFGCCVAVSILNPDGSTLITNTIGGAALSLGPIELPANGTYTLLVAPTGANSSSGSASVTLWLFNEPASAVLTPGTPEEVLLSTPGQSDALTFSGVAGQLASMQITNSNSLSCNLYVSIIGPDGTALTRPNNSCSNSFFLNPVTLPATGTYTVLVAPANGTTGSATVNLWLFSEQTGTNISPGTPTAVTVNTAGQSQSMPFFGAVGEYASVQFSNSTYGCCVTVSILNPDGSTLVSGTTGDTSLSLGSVALPGSGIYTLVVAPTGASVIDGSASVTLWLFNEPVSAMIAPGTPATATISVPGQSDLLAFNGTAGQLASVQIASYNFNVACANVTVTLLNPDGSTLTSGNACGSAFNSPVLLPETGIYILQISPQDSGVGSASVSLSLTAEPAGSITPGIQTAIAIGIPGQPDLLTFTGRAGQLTSLQITNQTFSSGCGNVAVSILNPDGTQLASANACGNPIFQNFLTLPATGTYTLAIAPQNQSNGGADVTLWLFKELSGSITAGVPATVAVNTPGQAELLTFSGASGQQANLQFLTNTFSSSCSAVAVSILNPDGTQLASANACGNPIFQNPVTLPVTGLYSLMVAPFSGNAFNGNAVALLWESGAPTATPTFSVEQGTYPAAQTVTLSDVTPGAAFYYTVSAVGQSASATPTTASTLYTGPITVASSATLQAIAVAPTYSPSAVGAATYIIAPPSTPVIAWTTPASIIAGTALGSSQLNASATINGAAIAGSYTYSPAAGTVPSAGAQTLSVTFTPADTVDYNTATATVTLTVTPAGVTPGVATLTVGQTQQFTAAFANTNGNQVLWTITPSNAGTISASGLYSAPASITAEQTVTVTATVNQTDSTQISATATINLTRTQCVWSRPNGYSYVRTITIDHTKVQNTDQSNFPVLFSVTNQDFASTAQGGHIASSSGYDILFSSDAAGKNLLNYELQEYDPIHGQVIAWVGIPTLSHTQDTVVYMFYGNPNVTASQQNPASVWDSNYKGVWHTANNGGQLSLADSTSNANNATNNGATAVTTGPIQGGMQTEGSSYATLGTPASLANLAQGNATFSAWVNASPSETGGLIMGKDDQNANAGWALGLDKNNNVDFEVVYNGSNFILDSSSPIGNGVWSYVTVTLAGGADQRAQAMIYINGVPSGNASGGSAWTGDDSAQAAYLANANYLDAATAPLNGRSDEFRISNAIRSADWIATEYSNQSAPAAFSSLSAETYMPNSAALLQSPSAVTLSALQTQQFTVPVWGVCGAPAVTWTVAPDGVGTVSTSGLYTAPASIAQQQTVNVTVSVQDGKIWSSSLVTLLPSQAAKATPTITWAAPAAISYGTALSAAQLNATASVAGTFAYTPALGTVLSGGAQTLTVTFTPTDTADFSTATATVLLAVNGASGTWDTGTIALSVNGSIAATTSYGEGSNPSSVAQGLAAGVVPGAPVSVTASGAALTVVATATGSGTNYDFLLQADSFDSVDFSQPSFLNQPIYGNLTGGADATAGNSTPVYQYTVPQGGYDPAGNLLSYTDTVMGSWNFNYDTLNRLAGASDTAPANPSNQRVSSHLPYYCWSYDAFGNRTLQSGSSTPFGNGSIGSPACQTEGATVSTWASYNANNQITGSSQAPGGPVYDPSGAGYILNDGVNQYLYDAEGRICAVKSQPVTGTYTMTGYLYDAEGARIAKGAITAWSCDPTLNGFQTSRDYILGPGGEQVTELARNNDAASASAPDAMVWEHTNVWFGSKLLATYDKDGLHFYLDDPLGTRRAQTDYAGNLEQTCSSLPYGDGLACSNSNLQAPTEHHFTGKERDVESGNDYFGARYYNSAMGRFMSPDPLIMTGRHLMDPQRWNRYAYALNDPVGAVDDDGMDATIIYSKGKDLTEKESKWVDDHKDQIFASIKAKLNKAGIEKVEFKSSDSLSASELKALANAPAQSDPGKTGTPGVIRLEFVGEHASFVSQQAPLGDFGYTSHGRSAVFLTHLIGLNAAEPGTAACDAVCGVANVAAHEIGHGFGFAAPGHTANPILNLFGITPQWPARYWPDLMKQGQEPFARPLDYRRDPNIQAINEVNHAKAFP
jgi:RHS repeat-associated protein